MHKDCRKTNMAPIRDNLFVLFHMCFSLLTRTYAVVGFSSLLELESFKMQKIQEFCRIFRYGCENPIECSGCAVEQKNCEWMIFLPSPPSQKGACFSRTTQKNFIKFGREILLTAVSKWKIEKFLKFTRGILNNQAVLHCSTRDSWKSVR